MPAPKVALVPDQLPLLNEAVTAGGGVPTPPSEADAIVWLDPRDPDGLKALLSTSPARWVQLPFAGIERFVETGVVDTSRIWTCAKGTYGPATAEQAVALLLAAARALPSHARAHTWQHASTERRLQGTTALLIGTGGIGSAFASFISPFGMRLIAVNRSGRNFAPAERTVPVSSLASVAGEADWIVLALALTASSAGLIDAAVLSMMKRDAWVINVARGGLVDTDALVEALRSNTIGGAALDVTDPEPLPDDHPLWSLPNAIVTSHTANTWRMAIPDLAALVERNVRAFARGEPLQGLVDPSLGY